MNYYFPGTSVTSILFHPLKPDFIPTHCNSLSHLTVFCVLECSENHLYIKCFIIPSGPVTGSGSRCGADDEVTFSVVLQVEVAGNMSEQQDPDDAGKTELHMELRAGTRFSIWSQEQKHCH